MGFAQKNNQNESKSSASSFLKKKGSDTFLSQGFEKKAPFISPSNVQAKLSFGSSNDKFEQEADDTADSIVQKLEANPSAVVSQNNEENVNTSESKDQPISEISAKPQVSSSIQKSEGDMAKDSENDEAQSEEIPEDFQGGLSSSKGSGDALPEEVNAKMGKAFNADFSNVRVHTGASAVQLNRQIGAQAFAHGNDIYFNKGKYSPNSKAGSHLLAHELTHTIQQGAVKQSKGGNSTSVSGNASPSIQAAPIVTGINVPTEIGVDRTIRASALIAPGTPRRTGLTWSLVGAPAGIAITGTGRRVRITADPASVASAGSTFQISCTVTGAAADTFTSPNITLVAVTGITFTAAPAFVNQPTAFPAPSVFPPNTADPNRQGVAGNTATVNIVTNPVGRATTVRLVRRRGANVAGNVITPGAITGQIPVRVTDDATRTRMDQNLTVNNVPTRLNAFNGQAASPNGTYGALNALGWNLSDPSPVNNRSVGETITAGGRDDFGFTPGINFPIGPNPAPINALSAPANAWNDNLWTSSGAAAGPAGDANMINVNRYVGRGVAQLPRVWILRQGFHWRSWTGAWSNEFDNGVHRRSLRRDSSQPSGFGFRTEHRFPLAKSPVWNEPYVGPPLINLTGMTVNPLAPLADEGLAADGVATANVNIATTVPGRLVNWSVARGTPAFTAGAAGAPVANAATLTAGLSPRRYRLSVADTVFAHRNNSTSFTLQRVRLRRMISPTPVVPAGTNVATVNLEAKPGGRVINWSVDAAAAAAGVTVAPVANPVNVINRSATVTRPAAFTGRVRVTASDSILATSTNSTRIRFR